jgi:hypothetical protein
MAFRSAARSPSGAFLILCLLTLQVSTFAADSSSGVIKGRVTDQNDEVVAQAKVQAINIDTNIPYSTETNSDGIFVIVNIPPGRYRLHVEHPGFQSVEKPDVVVHVQDILSINFGLQVGSVTQSMTIEGGAPIVNSESATVGTLVNRSFVENMPLNGRSFQGLIELTPGIVLTPASETEPGQFSVNGQRTDSNYFMVDGVSANIGVPSGPNPAQTVAGALPGFSAFGGTNNLVSVDAMQEFRVQTSTFAAEYGRTPGAQISISTRSGTNQFHGDAFDYLRNDIFDANDWFSNANHLPRAALRQNDFGGVIGGPIFKDKTFFFFSYEGLRLRQPQTELTVVPSLSARTAAAAGMQPFFNGFPLPNGPDFGNGFAEFAASFSNPTTLNATSIRIDHTIGKHITIFGRYNYAPSSIDQRGNGLSLNTTTFFDARTQTFTVGSTQSIRSDLNNDLRFNYSRNSGAASFTVDSFGGAQPPAQSAEFPGFTSRKQAVFDFAYVGAGGQTSFEDGTNVDNLQTQINVVDGVTYLRGRHELKFGIDYRRLAPRYASAAYFQAGIVDPTLSKSGLADIGVVLTQGTPRYPVFTNVSSFAQDTFRVAPRLTLTLGLRWEINPAPKESRGNDPLVILGSDNPATMTPAPFGTKLFKTTFGNFAPRFGVSYQWSNHPGFERVIRGGAGIFYDLGEGPAGQAFGNTSPYEGEKLLFGVPFPLSAANAAPAPPNRTPPFVLAFGVSQNLKLPYTVQANVAIEQSLGRSQSITASYVMAIGRRLLFEQVLSHPNPEFVTVGLLSNGGTSDYHALQVQYQRRLAHGLQAVASYTWSHSIDTGSSDFFFHLSPTLINPQTDRGASAFDIRHTFTGALTYDIPSPSAREAVKAVLGGWSIDSFLRVRSAPPLDVVTGFDPLGLGTNPVFRPNVDAAVPVFLYSDAFPGGKQLNRAAFSVPTPGVQGNLGRDALRGFGATQVDFAIRRLFPIHESIKLQFRAEFFNVFNHPNFGPLDSNLMDALFGQSTAMLGRSLGSGGASGGFSPLYQVGGPRSMQFALKLLF